MDLPERSLTEIVDFAQDAHLGDEVLEQHPIPVVVLDQNQADSAEQDQALILDDSSANVFWPWACQGEVYQPGGIDDCEQYYPYLGSLFHYNHPGTGRHLVQSPYFDPYAIYFGYTDYFNYFSPFQGLFGQADQHQRKLDRQDAFKDRIKSMRRAYSTNPIDFSQNPSYFAP
jgi:hypothetical protein